MKGVHTSGDSEVLVVRTFAEAAVLEKADHGYQLVIGCRVIMIARLIEHGRSANDCHLRGGEVFIAP
jgi:hypothetical protein